MITLYYISGISAVDEPNPNTEDQQNTFFEKYKVVDIDSGFYPPHYHNEIVLSTEDISFDKSFNYLSIVYNNKRYYYFIDNIEYISEDTIKVYLTLDTLQTYRFNINFYNSSINRLSIERWVNGKINRNYIRTNRSKGTMEQQSLLYTNREVGWYVIIINSASTLYIGEEGARSIYSEANTSGLTNSPIDNGAISPLVNVIAIPVPLSSTYTKLKYNNVTYTRYSGVIRLRMIGGINGVESITYYDYDIFKEYISKTYSGDTITLATKNTTYLRQLHFWLLTDATNAIYTDLGWMFAPINILNIPYYYTDIALPEFEMSVSSTYLMDSKYVPAMLDENYIQVEFGERTGYATYPLHYLVGDNNVSGLLYGVCMVNYIDGGRSYYLTTDVSIDTYHTLITTTSIEQIALYNDAWQTYLSQNMCTLMRGRSLAYQQIGYQSIMSGFNNKDNNKLFNVSNIQPYTTYSSTGPITTSGYDISYNYKMMGRMVQAGTNISLQASLYNQSREIQENNMHMQPDNQKVGNSCASDCTSGILRVYQKVYKCSDFEDVAKDYEMNGYDVAIHSSENLFNYHLRYYYDVIRTDDITIALKNVPTDNFILLDIKNRFKKGVRLWHMNADGVLYARIGNYSHDNVELDNL